MLAQSLLCSHPPYLLGREAYGPSSQGVNAIQGGFVYRFLQIFLVAKGQARDL
jgi:hypothetical protein